MCIYLHPEPMLKYCDAIIQVPVLPVPNLYTPHPISIYVTATQYKGASLNSTLAQAVL